MRLQSIKLSGFKSFAEPTNFMLPGQLVGVVGPNGCGKSNIMDAVRWVLGESKASELRGESMMDVIFNGSSNRKPVSRASVELIFENLLGRALGFSKEDIHTSFIKVNNELVLSSGIQCEPRQLLVLLPHCIQSSRCTHRLTYHIDNCARCGACPLKDVLNLRDTYGVQVAIATGGTIARRIVVQARPKLIVAVACERDLSSGIQDTHPLPVFGVINERPNGPCLDTFVSIRRLESAIRHFIGIE